MLSWATRIHPSGSRKGPVRASKYLVRPEKLRKTLEDLSKEDIGSFYKNHIVAMWMLWGDKGRSGRPLKRQVKVFK